MSFIAGYILGLSEGEGGAGEKSLAEKLADSPMDYSCGLSSNYRAEMFTDFDNRIGLNTPRVDTTLRSTPQKEMYVYFCTMRARTYVKIIDNSTSKFLFGWGKYQDSPLGSGGINEKIWYFPADSEKYLSGESTKQEIRSRTSTWQYPSYLNGSWTLTYSPEIYIKMTYYDSSGEISGESEYSGVNSIIFNSYSGIANADYLITDLSIDEYAEEIRKFNLDIYNNPWINT